MLCDVVEGHTFEMFPLKDYYGEVKISPHPSNK